MNAEAGKADTPQKAPLKPAYLILGDDHPKVEYALRRLRARIVEESGTELNIDEFHAGRHPVEEVVAAANTLAFLGGIRLVLVHGVEAWRKEDKVVIARYLAAPAFDACLALVGEGLPPADPLRKAMKEAGEVLEYRAPRPAQMPDWVVNEARKMRLALELPEARLIVQRVGDDQHVLLRELEKLAAYCGRHPVLAEDVYSLVTRTVEARVFDLIDAVATRRSSEAFSLVEELYLAGERPTSLFIRVQRHFQHLSRAVAMRDEGYPAARIQESLGLKPFPARKLVQQSGLYDGEGIRRAMSLLAEADARLKGMGDLPDRLEFELCLGRLLVSQ